MNPIRRLLPILSLVSCLTVPAQAADPGALALARRTLQDGMNHGDTASMLKARGQFLGLLAAEPDSPALHYWVALADWRLVPMLSGKDAATAKRHCDEGLAQCDAALQANAKFADALALKAGLQGMAIQFNGAAGITLAPQMVSNMARAVEMAPANPRVRLLDGIGTFHMPVFFGGGPDKALEKLKKAHALYAAESPTDSTSPAWGRDDAFVWAGRCEMQLKEYTAARDYFRQALEANPANGWVRMTLLPAAEDSLVTKGKDKS